MSSSVLLRDFVYKLCICSEKAANIARYIRLMQTDFNNVIEAKQLDENHGHLNADYKTFADVIIQEVIKRDLGETYTSLGDRIYGEEDGSLKLPSSNDKIIMNVNGSKEDIISLLNKLFTKESTKSIETLADTISSSSNGTLSEQCIKSFENIPNNITIDLSDIGIWIDPIDGTQEYINGTDGTYDSATGIVKNGLPAALVLIGCFDIKTGRALVGVVNRAFNEKINESTWTGSIYWGASLSSGKFNNLQTYNHNRKVNERVLLYGSVDSKNLINTLNKWIKLQAAGCGNKLLATVLKQANIYLLTRPTAFYWDLCAVHALLRSIDGQILDLHEIINYFRENKALNTLNISKFEILYNYNSAEGVELKSCACRPFIVYYDERDLHDFLQNMAFTMNFVE